MFLSDKHAQQESPDFSVWRPGDTVQFYCKALMRDVPGRVIARQDEDYYIIAPLSQRDWRYGQPTQYRLHYSQLAPPGQRTFQGPRPGRN